MKLLLKKLLPKRIIQAIKNFKAGLVVKKLKKSIRKSRNGQPLFFLLATPNHGNIGDQAIAIAERSFFANEFPKRNVIEVSFNEYHIVKAELSKLVEKKDIICYHGGGNMGTQYFECEEVFRDMIERFSQNRIVAFPQTIFYSEEQLSQEEFEKSKRIYNSHENLTLFARESVSYGIMKEAYSSCKVFLVPDIVLYLERTGNEKRKGAATFLRNDVEKRMTNEENNRIYGLLEETFGDVLISDTVCDSYNVTQQQRGKIFQDKLHEFRNSEVAVTDRLHGMVFAYLTDTPCVVLSNYNHKVLGVYEWIKSTEKIKFIADLEDIEHAVSEVCQVEESLVQFDKGLYAALKEALD